MKTFTTTAELSHRYHSFFMAILTFPLYFECNDFKCLQFLCHHHPLLQNYLLVLPVYSLFNETFLDSLKTPGGFTQVQAP